VTLAIAARGLQKRFGETHAIDDLTLEVPRGTAFALLGPNGAGKTTSVRLLTALLAPSAGEAEVCGLRLGRDDDAIRRAVGLLTEVPGLYPRLSAMENLLFFAELYDLPAKLARARIEPWLKRFELWDRRDHAVGGFSTGMRQKLALARALVHDPTVLFLDEPTSGLDPESTRTVRDLIREYVADGRTVILCTHHLDEAERLCNQVAFIRRRVLAVEPVTHAPRAAITLEGDAAPFLAIVARAAEVDESRVTVRGHTLTVATDPARHPEIVRALTAAGAGVVYLAPDRGSLEARYFELLAPSGAPS
jgi:ABC-2 type transport system ATP-binding protein